MKAIHSQNALTDAWPDGLEENKEDDDKSEESESEEAKEHVGSLFIILIPWHKRVFCRS